MEKNTIGETKIFPVWKELVKIANTWEYGTFHSHEEIAEIIDCEIKTSKYYQNIQKAREQLILYRKLLETHVDKGYFVTEINRYNEVTFEDIRKSKKYLELSVLKSTYAPIELMDDQTRKKHDVFLVKQVGLLNMSLPFYTEITKVIAPIPSRFQIKESKPKQEELK
jgi:hypothetical protein